MKSSRYISKSACRGYRPRTLASYNVRQRPQLISRLARERTVTRFIVAPAGYGKTALALDYAETMFAWSHVYWLNAKSPCFIRDLDDGDLAAECLANDANTKLVVMEDIPQLDAQRARGLSDEIDALLENDCEVIVTCTPSCDMFGGMQQDRLRISALDLLLDDDELDDMRGDAARLRGPVEGIPQCMRVPALIWGGGPDAAESFARDSLGEDVPADLLLTAASALVLRRGSLEDLDRFGTANRAFLQEVADDYPHLGIDVGEDRFETPDLGIDAVTHVLKGKLDALTARSGLSSRAELACAWADLLLSRGVDADRACDVARVLCVAKDRARWLVANARQLVRSGCFYHMHCLIASLDRSRYDARDCVKAIDALCCRMLGDEKRTVALAKRVAFDDSARAEPRVACLLMTTRFAPAGLAERATGKLESWVAARLGEVDAVPAWHEALAVAWVAREGGISSLAGAWEFLRQRGADTDALCIVASWAYDMLGGIVPEMERAPSDLEPIERFVRERLASEDDIALDFFATSAGLAMEKAHVQGMEYFGGPLSAGMLLALRRAETDMLCQRRQYDHDKRVERSQRDAWESRSQLVRTGQLSAFTPDGQYVPPLHITTFGRFDVSIGGTPIDPAAMSRKHTRVLLVLLAANYGHDISRDSIASAMWPSSNPDVARKNFYTVWSQLKHALQLPDGSCPYLVRSQFGCRLNEQYVRSDIARLDDICRELLFGRLDFDSWLEMYNEIDRDFASELLPTEQSNHLVVKARENYRNRMVDALVAGALRLVDAGNPQWGIWFARAAVSHAPTREDAYVALMRSQIAHGQRTAAMMTFHSCRRVLAEELGIDPSPETVALYEGLLD